MKHFLTAIALVLTTTAAQADNIYQWQVQKVIDGDTVIMNTRFYPPELGFIHVRIKGIDTPESGGKAKCEKERMLAIKAHNLSSVMMLGRTVTATQIKTDKYGGRLVANLSVDGKDVGRTLIAAGLAKPYDGGTKSSWCF